HGIGNLIPGMEEGLEGKSAGEKFTVKISPEKGYGTKEPGLIRQVSRTQFEEQDLQVGMRFRTPAGISTITHIEKDTVTLDANHPLAGVELNFDVEITDVRAATKDELAHGHVHGPGGHHH
ncbi:MAG: peptidylprolyl isomerase, partial [Candidatus Nephrothrix sp. EaCA]